MADIVKGSAPDTSAFGNSNSYQSRALAWVESTSNGMSEGRILQRFALASIYYATYNVPTTWSQAAGFSGGWFIKSGWLTSTSECSWHGVSCNSRSEVEVVRLDSNGLTGSFPKEVTLLKGSLLELDLTKNFLSNDDASFFGSLTNLEVLLMGHNAIIGSGLPSSWKNLVNLRSLDVGYCLFHGAIHDGFFSAFPDLEYLDISGNTFNGAIPSTVASLSSLKFLYMQYTDLQGSLDPILKSGLRLIEELWCDDNPNLQGTIASEVGQLTTLKSLSLVNCNLSGSIPSSIGNLVNMEQLWLSENKLSGSVPSGLGSLKQMEIFFVQKNSLQGSIPSSVCSIPYLNKLGGDCNVCPSGCCTCCGAQCSNI